MLQRRAKISPNFSMASMTDVIFLLLIFFMITSTVVSPNAIKVLLPQGKQQTSAKTEELKEKAKANKVYRGSKSNGDYWRRKKQAQSRKGKAGRVRIERLPADKDKE